MAARAKRPSPVLGAVMALIGEAGDTLVPKDSRFRHTFEAPVDRIRVKAAEAACHRRALIRLQKDSGAQERRDDLTEFFTLAINQAKGGGKVAEIVPPLVARFQAREAARLREAEKAAQLQIGASEIPGADHLGVSTTDIAEPTAAVQGPTDQPATADRTSGCTPDAPAPGMAGRVPEHDENRDEDHDADLVDLAERTDEAEAGTAAPDAKPQEQPAG